ncbi:rust resistance kinase Lr10-like [Bidens hawaiensis]|uniref:rust resistance kinase Lr10-like n=1 Tax=Bidens hawaiensis TaxID=980011 RepID=UPI00404AF3D9
MGYNNISGCIPPEFGNSTQLQRLDLSSNNLVGEIPKKFGKMKGMLYLSLKDNQLSGAIPQELGSLHKMEHFDLSTNKLNGSIPKYIGEWKQIHYLNLSNNKINGKIPSEVGQLSNLTTLDFSWNSLMGEIPSEIQSLVNLATLNLSHNRLSGSLPDALGKLSGGIDFNLSYNELVGPVPTSFAIFMNSSIQVFQGNLGLCGNVTGLKLCESQIPVKKNNDSFYHKLILVVSLPLFGAILLGLNWKFWWRKKAKYNANAEIFLKNNEFFAPKRYSYSQIQKITSSFEVKLGQGGFGSVYKGSLSNENLVAVKVLSETKDNGEDFINEVASVSRTSHVNIVNLVGFCLEGRRRALIYEFMPNGSLERFIYGRGSSSINQLGWDKLQQISIGIARGLEYLHRGCNTQILHFDIKPHNILLDQDFCPKISDFGLAKLFLEKRSMISVSCARGTPGYIAPELFSRSFGQVSHKSDVYSYGMMILEMVGGRRNVEIEVDHTSEIYFPHWIYKKVESGEEHLGLHGIVSDEENETARKMIIVGLWCTQTNPLNRPAIAKVLEMLEGGLELLEIPQKPYMCSP